ncbi:unnamed protein product, partial [Brassica rapa]
SCFVDDKEEKKGSRRRVLLMISESLLHGDDELLITDMPKEEVESLFDSYEDSDFTRTESTAVVTVQPDVDHVTVSWIPANNLFAIMVSIIDQDLAQKNVYQNQGVSFPDSY